MLFWFCFVVIILVMMHLDALYTVILQEIVKNFLASKRVVGPYISSHGL